MKEKFELFLIDYSCHPFSLDLAKKLAENRIKIKYFFSKKINLTGNFYKLYKKNFSIFPIDKGEVPKHNFFLRRKKEIEFGKEIIEQIKIFKPNKILLANLPLDSLYLIIRFCKKKNIKTYFWIQDLYYLAIRNVMRENKFLYFSIGFLIGKLYEYYEKYCYLNSTKNILITNKFLEFFPYRRNNYIINNWIPIGELHKCKPPKKKLLTLLKKFTFIYTGTLSYKHRSDILILLAKKFKNANVVILSNDKFAKILINKAKKISINNIFLYPLVSYQNLPKILSSCDIGLVNLNIESNNICVPSKILSYYKFGLPILASMPLDNLASVNIKKFKTGLVSEPYEIDTYLNNASKLINNLKLRKKFSRNGKDFAIKNFNIKKISKKFIKILEL